MAVTGGLFGRAKWATHVEYTTVVQMDSVISIIGGKRLLTIHFVESSQILDFLRDVNTSRPVIENFEPLDPQLGKDRFKQLFSVIATDNGSEFSNSKKIECRDYAG